MNSIQHIRTYDDLLKEEQRLTLLADWHRVQIKEDVEDVKRKFAAVSRVVSFISHPATLLKQNSLPGVGIGVGAGMLALRLAKNIGSSLLQRLFGKKKKR